MPNLLEWNITLLAFLKKYKQTIKETDLHFTSISNQKKMFKVLFFHIRAAKVFKTNV
jgi:hypothetical protein